MLLRRPIYPDINIKDYNTSNLHEYDPYVIKNNVVILDKGWFVSLPRQAITLMLEKVKDIEFGNVTIPHPLCDDNANKDLVKMYQSYLDAFDYEQWYHRGIPNGPKDVSIVPIDTETKKILSDMYKNPENKNPDLNLFKQNIVSALGKNKKYFMRLSSTSGKNSKPLEPVSTYEDIIRRLITNREFYEREYTRDKDTNIILIPWNDTMDQRYEFRIFVVNGVLTGASQQWWSQLFNYTTEELDNIQKALENINFLPWIHYKTFIGDVYIDNTGNDWVCKLIECNPFGAHCGAGSGLFNWITDYDLLHGKNEHGKNEPELRYLSIINH